MILKELFKKNDDDTFKKTKTVSKRIKKNAKDL